MANTNFPRLVKALRESLGLTQEQLAREIGVSFSTVDVSESGHRRPQPYVARRRREMADEAGMERREYNEWSVEHLAVTLCDRKARWLEAPFWNLERPQRPYG